MFSSYNQTALQPRLPSSQSTQCTWKILLEILFASPLLVSLFQTTTKTTSLLPLTWPTTTLPLQDLLLARRPLLLLAHLLIVSLMTDAPWVVAQALHPHPPASPPPQNTAYRPIARRKILSAHHGVHSTSRWSIWLAGVVPLCRFVTCPHCPPQEHQPLLPCTQTPAVRCSMRSLLLLTHLFN